MIKMAIGPMLAAISIVAFASGAHAVTVATRDTSMLRLVPAHHAAGKHSTGAFGVAALSPNCNHCDTDGVCA